MATPLVTFHRAREAGYYDKNAVWQIAQPGQPRYAYDPDNGNAYMGLLSYGGNENYTLPLYPQDGVYYQDGIVYKKYDPDNIDKQIISKDYIGNGATARVRTTNSSSGRVMFGINRDPEANSSYNSLDYAVYYNGFQLSPHINGSNQGVQGTFEAGDVIEVIYLNGDVIFTKNDIEFFRSSPGEGKLYYFDSWIEHSGLVFEDVCFYNKLTQPRVTETITFDSVTDWYEPESSTFYTEIYHQEHNIGQTAQIIGLNEQTGFIMRGADETVYIDYGDGVRLYAPGQLYRNQANKVAVSITATGRRIALNGRSAEDGVTAQVVDFDTANELSDALYLNNGYIRTKYFAQTFSPSELEQLTKL